MHGDFVILRTVLRWACQVVLPNGSHWLERDPTLGIKVDGEQNPLRPIASFKRFEKTRAALQQMAREADDLTVRDRWIKIEFALLLAETTGRRLGSIQALEWEDIDLQQGCIYWRPTQISETTTGSFRCPVVSTTRSPRFSCSSVHRGRYSQVSAVRCGS